MKQNDGIAYEKPELLKYSLYGIVNGADPGTSGPVDGDNPPGCDDEFVDD